MTMLLNKGSSYTSEYTSTDYPVLTADWAGSVSFYSTYPGVATFTKALVRVGNVMRLSLTAGEVLNLADGVYTVEATITNAVLAVSITSITYATVTPIVISTSPLQKVYGTIMKADGTPLGSPTAGLVSTENGMAWQTGWKGATVKASIHANNTDAGKIIGTETITTSTDATGYFELYLVQGLTATIVCVGAGFSVDVVVGATPIDISTLI